MLHLDFLSYSRKGMAPVLGVSLVLLLVSGCASQRSEAARHSRGAVMSLGLSPMPEYVAPREAWRLAEAYAQAHPDCEVLLGRGDSMLPFYQDNTVLVVAHLAMSELRVGMTVIFFGESGRPVAHVLVEKNTGGWRTRGVGNREDDRTPMRYGNYIGAVVKAYATGVAAAVETPVVMPNQRVAVATVAGN